MIEYEACDRLCHMIQNQIFQRDREHILSAEYSSISSNIRLKLKQLDNEVEQLKVKLNTCNRNHSMQVDTKCLIQYQLFIILCNILFKKIIERSKKPKEDRDELKLFNLDC